MSARRLALLGLAALLLAAPLAAAGSQNDPETGDDANDDVAVNGGVNCGLPAAPPFGTSCLWPVSTDFEWTNIDVDWAWVNDTADDLVFTVQMKAGASFEPGSEFFGTFGENEPFDFTYTFAFTVNGTPFVAIATMARDGEFALSGVAATFLVHDGNRLTLTVPKALVGVTGNGAVIGSLVFTAHAADDDGNTLDDRAPDTGGGRDYAVANSTPPANVTAPADNAGNATQGPSGPSVVTGTSTGPRPTFSGTAERTFSVTMPAHRTAASDGKESPGLTLAASALALVALGVLLRRRL